MAYNNYFPQYYQPVQIPQQVPVSQQQIQQIPQVQNSVPAQNNLIWVSGDAGAKSYLVAPNTTIPLWDSESQTIYLKSADASGMPSMKILDYTIRDSSPAHSPVQDEPATREEYVSKAEFKKFEQEIKAQLKNLNRRGGKDDKQSNASNANDEK